MRVEYLFALFRTFDITQEERLAVQRRAAPLGGQMSIDGQIQNGERWIAALEAKAGVLLTHISMMIAVTGIMLAVSGDQIWYELTLGVELAAYLLLALLCIRCQNHVSTVDFSNLVTRRSKANNAPHHVYQNAIFGELLYREWLFPRIQRMLYLLTILLILTVIYGLFVEEISVLFGGKS